MAERKEKIGMCLSVLKNNALLFLTLLGVTVGLVLGFVLNPFNPSDDVKMWLGLPGEVFMKMLKVTILPLIVSTVITGTASLEPKSNGVITLTTVIFILINNSIGVLVGLAVYYIVNPGDYFQGDLHTTSERTTHLQTQDVIADLIRNLFPDNIVTACFKKSQTMYEEKTIVTMVNGTNVTVMNYVRDVSTASGTNILGITIFSTLVGMATSSVGDIGQPFINFFKGTAEITMRVLCWLIWFTPVGVASLVAASIASVTDIASIFRSVGMFTLAVAVSTAILNLGLIPACYFLFLRRNPFRFAYTSLKPMIAAFAPPSSAIAMPVIINTCDTVHELDRRISGFVVPLGAALNRIGSCSFIIMGCLFLCRLEDIYPSVGTILVMSLLTLLSSLALPSVPSGSIITILIVLSSVNVHTMNVGLLLALEWLTDRLRTTSNTFSITLSAVLVHHLCQSVLTKSDKVQPRVHVDPEIRVTAEEKH